jgi:hypothetical protein
MPLRPRINTLPATVRAQLDRKLKAADYGSLVEIAAWLRSKGYPIQKSAVGAYSKRLQAAAEARKPGAEALRRVCQEVVTSAGAAPLQQSRSVLAQEYLDACAMWAKALSRPAPAESVDLRLACLQSAARSPGSTAAVLKRAEAFAAWVKTGKAPGAGK